MSFGSSEPVTQTTTQMLSPEQRQLMNLAMPGVTQYAAMTPQRYPGEQVAGFTAPQEAGQAQALQAAGTQTQLAGQGAGTTSQWLSPDALDITKNPGLQGTINAATRPITQALTEQALPAIRDSAERSRNFGSSRQGVAEGIATRGAETAIGDTTQKLVSDAYKTNVDAQLKALGLLPQTVGTQTTGALTTSNVGDVQQALNQARINEAVQNFNFDKYGQFGQSQDIMSLLSGLPGGSTQTVASGPQKNRLTGALGGAAAGASLGSMFGPIGTAGGAGLGALLSFLG